MVSSCDVGREIQKGVSYWIGTGKGEEGGTYISSKILLLGKDRIVHLELGSKGSSQLSDLGLIGVTESLPAVPHKITNRRSGLGPYLLIQQRTDGRGGRTT